MATTTVSIKSDSIEKLSPEDFDTFLPWAVKQLGGEFDIHITRTVQAHYVSVAAKERLHKQKHKTKLKNVTDDSSNAAVTASNTQQDSVTQMLPISTNGNIIFMKTTYNDTHDLVRIDFIKNKKIPRLLFKVVALALPYHKTLSSININQGLCAEAIHEIVKYYPDTRITELYLDNCHVPEGNYHLLLDNDIIKHLSLSRCLITDTVVKIIASKLLISCPAAKSLSVLNLSVNRITDVGVEYLADMLRSNRQVSFLNLAHNRITDTGALSIFDTLENFILTQDEKADESRRLISYLKRKNYLIFKTIKELRSSDSERRIKKKSVRQLKKKTEKDVVCLEKDDKSVISMDAIYYEKAQAIVESILGEFIDPFSKENTMKRDGLVYCLGNNSLCYLNLAYNNLTHISVRRLFEVIKTQRALSRKPKGLINVRLDGNYLPKHCLEYDRIDELLLSGFNQLLKKSTAVSSISKNLDRS